MLYRAIGFMVGALIAMPFGFSGLLPGAAWVAKVLFLVCIVMFVVSLNSSLNGRGGREYRTRRGGWTTANFRLF